MTACRARVFVGLALGADLGGAVAARVAEVLDPAEYRLARAEGLHLTLHYVGSLARERLPALGRSLAEGMEGLEAPELTLEGTGAFPDWTAARVLWIGVREVPGPLQACHGAVGRALGRVGLGDCVKEEVFRPHVTVARPKAGRALPPEEFVGLRCDFSWVPADLCLLESRSAAGGAHYEPLARLPFEGA